MNTPRVYGHTKSGEPVSDELVEQLAHKAEHGYDVDELIDRRGRRERPRLASGQSTVESIRLDLDPKERLVPRAEDEGVPASEVIRAALRHHLEAS